MRFLKISILSLLIGGISLAAWQIVLKPQSVSPIQVVTKPVVKPKIRVVSSIPRHETGRYSLGEVFLLSNGEIWAAGYDGKRTGTLFHSKDLGSSWEVVKVSKTGYNTRAVMFVDEENGWAVGVSGLAVQTTDGGKS